MYLGIVRDYLKDFWDTWWPVVRKYLVMVWDFLSEHIPVLLAKTQELLTNLAYKIYELAPDFFSSVASWFAKLGEKIVEKLPDVLAVIQEYAVIAVNLAVNLVNSAVEWLQNVAGRYVVTDRTVAMLSCGTCFSAVYKFRFQLGHSWRRQHCCVDFSTWSWDYKGSGPSPTPVGCSSH